MVAGILLIACIGVVNLGLLLWTQEALQSAAMQTARCAALGASPCASPQQYAVNIAAAQSFPGVTNTANVWVQANATCASTQGNVTAGKYTVVTITSTYWSSLLASIESVANLLRSKVLTATACYPSAAP